MKMMLEVVLGLVDNVEVDRVADMVAEKTDCTVLL